MPCVGDNAEPAVGYATEQTMSEEEGRQRSPYERLVYAILNEFIGLATFSNADVGDMLRAAIDDASQLDADMQARITEVFQPIFFHFTYGAADHTMWEPRDAGAYIKKWEELAALRDVVIPYANDRHIHLSKVQVRRSGISASKNSRKR